VVIHLLRQQIRQVGIVDPPEEGERGSEDHLLHRSIMADFKEIDHARKILRLGEFASLEEIKEAYRRLSLQYHPDRCTHEKKKECEEIFKKITCAYEIITSYCSSYRYSFKDDDVKRSGLSKEAYDHLKRFYDGWWGDLGL